MESGAIPQKEGKKKWASEDRGPCRCEGKNLQRGTAGAAALGGEAAMCISCMHYDHFLIRWKTFIVQCSYANAALLRQRLNAALTNRWR